MVDVFISYKSERRPAAAHLARVLELHGYSVWFDYELVSGRDFSRQIEAELRGASLCIVLWCKLSVASEWVLEEAHIAKESDKILPVWIEPANLPLGFTRLDTIDLSNWDGNPLSHTLNRFWTMVETRTGREPAANLKALRAYEETWRRFGSPPLARFALGPALDERQSGSPRPVPPSIEVPALGAAIPARPAALEVFVHAASPGDHRRPARAAWIGGGVLLASLLALGVELWPSGAAQPVDAAVAVRAAGAAVAPVPAKTTPYTPASTLSGPPAVASDEEAQTRARAEAEARELVAQRQAEQERQTRRDGEATVQEAARREAQLRANEARAAAAQEAAAHDAVARYAAAAIAARTVPPQAAAQTMGPTAATPFLPEPAPTLDMQDSQRLAAIAAEAERQRSEREQRPVAPSRIQAALRSKGCYSGAIDDDAASPRMIAAIDRFSTASAQKPPLPHSLEQALLDRIGAAAALTCQPRASVESARPVASTERTPRAAPPARLRPHSSNCVTVNGQRYCG